MSVYKRFSNGNCPVCGGARNDCRQNPFTGMVHCFHPTANPLDYKYVGIDGIGFGMWIHKRDEEIYNAEQRQEWSQQRQERIQQRRREQELRKQEEKERCAKLLSNSERHKVIVDITDQLPLYKHHEDAIIKRMERAGLSKEVIQTAIDQARYSSVKAWQKLDRRVNNKLAGVKRNGMELMIPAEAILCPIPNVRGEYVAYQLRFTHNKGFRRFVWNFSEESRKHLITTHLQNGELALAVYFPHKKTPKPAISLVTGKKIVGLCEGTGFKPHIAALRIGIPVIGASGGNHASSPETLRNYLDYLGAEETILYPDANAVLNKNVLRSYKKTFDLLAKWGIPCKVAWWGQIDKTHEDVDEVPQAILDNAEYLTPEEFLKMASKEQYWHEVLKAQKKLNTLTYPVNLKLNQKFLPDLKNTIPLEALLQGILAIQSRKGSGKSFQLKDLIQFWRKEGKFVISITPRIALGREQALKWDITWIDDNNCTETINVEEEVMVQLGLQKSLSGDNDTSITTTEKQFGLKKGELKSILSALAISLCWDSLRKLMARSWENTVVIIDESELGLTHLATSSTCKEKRVYLFQAFQDKIKECLGNEGLVVLSDADLTDIPIDYVKAIAPEAPVFTVVNEYLSPELRWQIDFYSGRKDAIIEDILVYLEQPKVLNESHEITRKKRLLIACDSKKEADALERKLHHRFPNYEILNINSSTTELDWGKKFVQKPNESILDLRPEIVIYTTSMGVGISIDVHYFDKVYGIFTGVLEPSQCRQMLARDRNPIPRAIWVKERSFLSNDINYFLPEKIKEHLFKDNKEGFNLIDLGQLLAGDGADAITIARTLVEMYNPETKTWDNAHLDLYCKLLARRNFALSQLAVQLRQELIEEGHYIRDFTSIEKTRAGDELAEIKEALNEERAERIDQAKDIPFQDAQRLQRKATKTAEEHHQITKAFLKAELPGIEENVPCFKKFILEAILKDNRRSLNGHKLFWLCQHPEIAKTLDSREWREKLLDFGYSKVVYLPDLYIYTLKVKCLQDLGLFDFVDLQNGEKTFQRSSPELLEFIERARKMKYQIYQAFKIKVPSDSKQYIQFINKLLGHVGLAVTSRTQSGENRQRAYSLDLDLLNDINRLAILESLDRKFTDLLNSAGQNSTPAQHAPIKNITTIGASCAEPQTPSPEEIEPDFPSPEPEPAGNIEIIPPKFRGDVEEIKTWYGEMARQFRDPTIVLEQARKFAKDIISGIESILLDNTLPEEIWLRLWHHLPASVFSTLCEYCLREDFNFLIGLVSVGPRNEFSGYSKEIRVEVREPEPSPKADIPVREIPPEEIEVIPSVLENSIENIKSWYKIIAAQFRDPAICLERTQVLIKSVISNLKSIILENTLPVNIWEKVWSPLPSDIQQTIHENCHQEDFLVLAGFTSIKPRNESEGDRDNVPDKTPDKTPNKIEESKSNPKGIRSAVRQQPLFPEVGMRVSDTYANDTGIVVELDPVENLVKVRYDLMPILSFTFPEWLYLKEDKTPLSSIPTSASFSKTLDQKPDFVREPDWRTFPHLTSNSISACRNRALEVKNRWLSVKTEVDLNKMKDEQYYLKEMIWVYLNLLTEKEKARVRIAGKTKPTKQLGLFDDPQQVDSIEFQKIIDLTDFHMERLGWTEEKGRSHLNETYGKSSRHCLNDKELIEFLEYLTKKE